MSRTESQFTHRQAATVTRTQDSPLRGRPGLHSSQNSRHAIVIGAGLGGLSTATHLARDGWRVTLLERNARCGGRMNVIEENGFRIDMGPTLLMMPDVLHTLFESCGRRLSDYLDLRRLDPAYRVRFADGTSFTMRGSVAEMQADAARLSPDDARRLPGLMRAMEAQYTNARFNFIERPFNTLGDLMSPQTLTGLARALPMRSVYNFVARHIKDERLRAAFTFQTLYLGISPFRCPSVYALLPYIEMEFGVWFPMGGMISVANALTRLLQELGVTIRTCTPVRRIVTEGRRVTGVEIAGAGQEGGFLPADVVVSNVDTPTTYAQMLAPNLRRRHTDTKLASRDYSCSAYLLYLGVRDLESDFGHHEVLLSEDYRETLEDITRRGVLPRDPALYVCIPTRTDPSLAPAGHQVVYVLMPCPHLGGEVDWTLERRRLRETILTKLEQNGMPGLREKIVFEEDFTPEEFEYRYGCYQGSAFGLSPLFFQSAYFRPRMQSEEVEGLYFTGAGTHPGGGVPIVLTSGRLAAEAIAARYGTPAANTI